MEPSDNPNPSPQHTPWKADEIINTQMTNYVYVDYEVLSVVYDQDHLIKELIARPHSELWPMDYDYRFTRELLISLMNSHESFFTMINGERKPLNLVKVEGKIFIRVDSEEIAEDRL